MDIKNYTKNEYGELEILKEGNSLYFQLTEKERNTEAMLYQNFSKIKKERLDFCEAELLWLGKTANNMVYCYQTDKLDFIVYKVDENNNFDYFIICNN